MEDSNQFSSHNSAVSYVPSGGNTSAMLGSMNGSITDEPAGGSGATMTPLMKTLKLAVGALMMMAIVCIMINSGLSQNVLMSALINSCCPGGVMSNFLTHLTRGDVALSVTMSFLSTVCAFFTMPLSLWAFSGFFVDGASVDPPYVQIAGSLASLIIPLLIGVLLKYFKESFALKFKKVGKAIIIITLLATTVIFGFLYPNIYFVGKKIIFSGLLVALAGFFFGYSISRVCRLPEKQCRAVCFETGFQNVAISFAVIQLGFPDKSDEMFAFPLWYATGVGVYSTIFVFAFHVHKRVTGRREGRDDDHEARGRHKKVNSQTVQLVNPTGSDPDDHVNEEEEGGENESSLDDSQHRHEGESSGGVIIHDMLEYHDEEPNGREAVVTFSTNEDSAALITNNNVHHRSPTRFRPNGESSIVKKIETTLKIDLKSQTM
ncbi:ileal sodium/bile acid cotransporter-like isoform X2 [Symsagittifera roscoffensis]|uniref:ileal sodium/bile acid cotransporter-like isoform X2 n=1 Tax=Symsagittifera roscoffensis TaxID=84072 RepID=UPI00307B3B63